MAQKTDKIRRLKRAGTIIAIAGGMTLGGMATNRTTDKKIGPIENTRSGQQADYAVDKMTHEQKLQFIQVSKKMLDELQQKIDSKETNSEERFEARRSYREISQQMDSIQKRLDKER